MPEHLKSGQTKFHDYAPKKPPVMSIFDFSADALGELRTWLEQNPPAIPVTQILGFAQFTALAAPYIGATESTTSTSFTDLATVGPVLTGLSDGQYVVMFGCTAKSAAADEADMGIAVNTNGVDPTQTVVTLTNSFTSMAIAVVVQLRGGGNNSITAKYLSLNGGSASFGRRWMLALRFSN